MLRVLHSYPRGGAIVFDLLLVGCYLSRYIKDLHTSSTRSFASENPSGK